jgi:hypothetical protein
MHEFVYAYRVFCYEQRIPGGAIPGLPIDCCGGAKPVPGACGFCWVNPPGGALMGGAPIAGGPTGRVPKAGPLGPGGRAPGRPFAVGAGNPASISNGVLDPVSHCGMQPGILCSLLLQTSTMYGYSNWCNAMQLKIQRQCDLLKLLHWTAHHILFDQPFIAFFVLQHSSIVLCKLLQGHAVS